MAGDERLDRLWAVLGREFPHSSIPHFRDHLGRLFGTDPLAGRSVLDVGAGSGYYSAYIAARGARRVVAIEPELAGSREGMTSRFERIVAELGLDQVESLPTTFQEYDPRGERFDVVLLGASINHLDEEACERIHRDPAAVAVYGEIFRKLRQVAGEGARLIVTDVSRHNLFGHLGLRNPFRPSIEWNKHQSPETWARLLEDAGFRNPRIRWPAFSKLGAPGRLLLSNKPASYFLTSTFVLEMDA